MASSYRAQTQNKIYDRYAEIGHAIDVGRWVDSLRDLNILWFLSWGISPRQKIQITSKHRKKMITNSFGCFKDCGTSLLEENYFRCSLRLIQQTAVHSSCGFQVSVLLGIGWLWSTNIFLTIPWFLNAISDSACRALIKPIIRLLLVRGYFEFRQPSNRAGDRERCVIYHFHTEIDRTVWSVIQVVIFSRCYFGMQSKTLDKSTFWDVPVSPLILTSVPQ